MHHRVYLVVTGNLPARKILLAGVDEVVKMVENGGIRVDGSSLRSQLGSLELVAYLAAAAAAVGRWGRVLSSALDLCTRGSVRAPRIWAGDWNHFLQRQSQYPNITRT